VAVVASSVWMLDYFCCIYSTCFSGGNMAESFSQGEKDWDVIQMFQICLFGTISTLDETTGMNKIN